MDLRPLNKNDKHVRIIGERERLARRDVPR
jgi:hypothetical protein